MEMTNKEKRLLENLAYELKVDPADIEFDGMYRIGDKSYEVFETEDAATEYARSIVRDCLDEYIYCACRHDLFDCMVDDCDEYANLLDNEVTGRISTIKARCIKEASDEPLTEEMQKYGVEDEDELAECIGNEILDEYHSLKDYAMERVDRLFSSHEKLADFLLENDMLEENDIIKRIVERDGIGPIIASYDGATIWMLDDTVAFRCE